jgi:uncharacterized protein (DUF58 family)
VSRQSIRPAARGPRRTAGATKISHPSGLPLRSLAPEQALRRLSLIVTRRLDGLLHGDYLGLVPGAGSELAETREYHPGEDDVRRIDWNVTARTTVPHVRDLVADRELETWALVDATPSMDFGTAMVEKRDLAVAAVAAVGFMTARAGNRIGAHVVRGDRVARVPARAGRAHLLGMLRLLLDEPDRSGDLVPPDGPGSAPSVDVPRLARAADGLRRSARRRGLVVVVSDFLDGLDVADGDDAAPAWERPIRHLAHRHHVLAVEIVDPRELELPDVGLLTLVDPETGRRHEISTASKRLRDRFAAAAANQRESVRAALRRTGANHLVLRTDRDWLRDIVWHVVAQRRLARAHAVRPGPPPAALRGRA